MKPDAFLDNLARAGVTTLLQARALATATAAPPDAPATPTTLAADLGCSTAALTGIMDKLDLLGLAVRVPKPENRRDIRLRATPAGRALFNP